jgi:hypothetical protein
MTTYRVVFASYCTEIVEAENEQDAIDLANGQFSPTYEWHMIEADIDDSFIQHKENENV